MQKPALFLKKAQQFIIDIHESYINKIDSFEIKTTFESMYKRRIRFNELISQQKGLHQYKIFWAPARIYV